MNIVLTMGIFLLCIHYGTFTSMLKIFTGSDTDVYSYFCSKSEIYKYCPHTDDDIVFIGDSITDRGEFHEYFPSISVKNRGIEGDTTEGILDRLDAICSVPPKKVFILAGINDIGDGINKEAFQKNYCSIVEKIKESDSETEVYIQSILPVNHDMMINNRRNSRRTTEAINDYNEILKDIAETSGGGVKYVDIGKQMMNADGDLDRQYTSDGVHLNGVGYQVWIDTVREYVED